MIFNLRSDCLNIISGPSQNHPHQMFIPPAVFSAFLLVLHPYCFQALRIPTPQEFWKRRLTHSKGAIRGPGWSDSKLQRTKVLILSPLSHVVTSFNFKKVIKVIPYKPIHATLKRGLFLPPFLHVFARFILPSCFEFSEKCAATCIQNAFLRSANLTCIHKQIQGSKDIQRTMTCCPCQGLIGQF